MSIFQIAALRRPSITVALAILTLIIGIGVIVMLVAIPSLLRIKELSTSIDYERARIELARQNAQKFKQTSATLEEVKNNLPGLLALTATSGKEIDFFATLETQNHRRDLDQLVRLGESPVSTSGTKELSLEFQLHGAFANIIDYLGDLEKIVPVISLRELTLRISTTADATDQPLTAILKGLVYVQP